MTDQYIIVNGEDVLVSDVARAVEGHGYILVPLVPTQAMIDAGIDCGAWGPGVTTMKDNEEGLHDASPDRCYEAMVAARPSFPSKDSGE